MKTIIKTVIPIPFDLILARIPDDGKNKNKRFIKITNTTNEYRYDSQKIPRCRLLSHG
ncbi:MAG: hypothetical protein ACK5XN_04365 [Bacteroidota bacterium]|jgi:hypothetical protein